MAGEALEIVIIGLGAGGLYASKGALNFNRKCHVTILEKRDHEMFSPCGLPFALEGRVDSFEELKHAVPSIPRKLDILINHEVTSIDANSKIVKARDLVSEEEKEFPYDQLIIGTGVVPKELPIPGLQELKGKGVHFVSDTIDAVGLQEAANSSTKKAAVVIGGGAVGIEVAEALNHLGLKVAITKRRPAPFPNNLDPEIGKYIVEHLEGVGIRVLFGKGIDSINGEDHVTSATIDGEDIECDIVVMAVGTTCRLELPNMIGAKTDWGHVVVNNRMETSVKDVYCVGDIIRTHSRINDKPAIMPLATSAFRQGLTAGVNAAGGDTSYPGTLNTFLCCIGGLEVSATGYRLEEAKENGFDAVAIQTKGTTKPHWMPGHEEIVLRVIVNREDGRILGGQAVGKEGAAWRVNIFALAIHGKMTLYDLMDAEFAYNPPSSQMYDPISQLAEIGLKRLRLPPKPADRTFTAQ